LHFILPALNLANGRKWLLKGVIRRPFSFALCLIPSGINIAQTGAGNNRDGMIQGRGIMKELGNSIAQLAAIIMILITLAVSTAAVSQWANSSDNMETQEQTLLASESR
jgi:hypothetical protein